MAIIQWKSQQIIDEEELDRILMPTQEEIEKAQREMDTINLLMELEVI